MTITTKKQLAKAISLKTGYSQADSKEMLDALIEVMRDHVAEQEIFVVREFGKLIYSKIPQREGFKPNRKGGGEYQQYKETVKILFSLSDIIRKPFEEYETEEDEIIEDEQ